MIFFSVIIPTYNRSFLITETIDSVLSQTYPHFEIIVVDDGSTDDTAEVIRKKYESEPRLRYYYKENEERGAARNYGLQMSKGDYAVIFDSDDWMHSDHLAVIEEHVSNQLSPPVNFIATKYQLRNGQGDIIPGGSSNLPRGWYGINEILKGSHFGCMYAINLHNPELFFFPPERKYSTLEDWMFLLKNLQKDKIFLIDQTTITVRHHENRSMSMNQRVITARRAVMEWGLENLSLSETQKKIFIAWSHYFCGIHEYLDHKRGAAVKEAILAIKGDGLQKHFLVLLAKAIVGRKLIKAIQ